MFKKLPSLPLLRTFEAAARNLSFKNAADELCVTPSAVSHQIKQLEAYLSVKLFLRHNRAIDLTPEGKLYFAEINSALWSIERATNKLCHAGQENSVNLNTFPFIATELLVPQLKRFKQQHPNIELKIGSTSQSLDFQNSNIDVAVRIGKGDWPGTVSEALVPVNLTPLCSPELLEQHDVRSFEDLLRQPLIHNAYLKSLWAILAKQNGFTYEVNAQDLWLDSIQSMIQAAEQGLGFTLMDVRCIPTRIKNKTLVAPFDVSLSSDEKVYLVYRENSGEAKGTEPTAGVKAVNDWIKSIFADL
ncbi:LysR substrate-binding domain-containing protein [Alkalimarinus coralli]|uniref:LysR substrate-binding domain-containing protein n=1 Tax=Alkalimarinus coralli TaxID=2935863 RepID=UPI00202B8F5F|nr:LysR substrate-binding domain-containing protein [Alkalimarinus coralli]